MADTVVSSGITSNGITITSGNTMTVSSGGTAINTTVETNGNMYISSGGVGNDTIVNYGWLYISGGTANSTTVNGGKMYISADGMANSTILTCDHPLLGLNVYLYVSNGGTADGTKVNMNGYLYVSSGGTANSTTINFRGSMFVQSGGTANNTTVNYYSYLYVSNGGTANSVTVNSGGSMLISSGGKLTGQMTFENGAVVSAGSGAIIDFDLTQAAAGGAALMNGKSLVDYRLVYTLTVDGQQESGIYTLMEGVTSFIYAISVVTPSDEVLGTIAVGETIVVGDVSYMLGLKDNNDLVLTVGNNDPEPVPVQPTIAYVNSEWANLEDGMVVSGSTIGYNAFAELTPAIAAVSDNGAVEITGGEISFADGYSKTITIDAGATVIGKATFDKAITINGTVAFDTANATAEAAQFGGFSFVSGAATYTLTDATPAAGTYLLASDVTTFDGDVTFGDVILKVDTEPVLIGDYTYELILTGKDELALIIAEYIPQVVDIVAPTVSNIQADITDPTNRSVIVTAVFDDDVKLASALYRIGDSGTWTDYPIGGVTVTENATVFFKAFDAAGNESETASYSVTNIDKTIPSAPDNLVATRIGNKLSLSWLPGTDDSGISQYILTLSHDGVTTTVATDALSYLIENPALALWSWSVQAVDGVGNKSDAVPGNDFEVSSDLAVSGFVVPDVFVANEKALFHWTIANSGFKPASVVRQSLYLVNLTDPERKTLLKTVYLSDLPDDGSPLEQSAEVVWNDNLGYTDSVFQIIIETEGDRNPADNTALSSVICHFEQKLSVESLPDTLMENSGKVRLVARRTGSPDTATSVSIVIEDETGLVSVSETVCFESGESEKVFYLTIGDNLDYQGNRNVRIQLQAEGYQSYDQSFILSDNEFPVLSFDVATTELAEGESYASFGKVKLNTEIDHDLRVRLSYDKAQLSGIPDYVVIKAGETEAQFALSVVDDATAEIDKDVRITASADGVASGNVSLLVKDNDIPAIALSVDKNIVAENAGTYALVGTIMRTDDSANYVKVIFTDVNSSELILPETVTLGTGDNSVSFYIGIVDNSMVDGDRTATVKANIYIDNCGCTVLPVSGETQVSFTILDQDGEALGLFLSQSIVAENTVGAVKLTVIRNTVNGNALTVHLNASGTSLLDLPETVHFAAGETSVTVDVSTLTDGISSGNQMAVITASAEGYASAVGYLNITDINLPDFTVSNAAVVETQAYAGKQALIRLSLSNVGLLDYTGVLNVNLALSNGTNLGTFKLNQPFPAGNEQEVSFVVTMPEITGQYFITATVDPSNLIHEFQENNNIGISDSFNIILDYSVTATVSQSVLYQKNQITITGTAQTQTGEIIPNQKINVLIDGSNGQQILSSVTDANGNYSLTVDTQDLPAGSYSVYAGALGSFGQKQDSFEIAGMKVVHDSAFIWDMKDQSTVSGYFLIENMSLVALTDVTINVLDAPENFKFSVDGPSNMDAGGKLVVNYTVSADGLTEGGGYSLTNGWQKIAFQVTSGENVSCSFNGYFYSSPECGDLALSVNEISASQNSEAEKYYEFSVTNTGLGDTGRITIRLPNTSFMRLISNETIDNLAYGETATVTIAVDASECDDLILNAPYTGSLFICAENANAQTLPFDLVFTTGKTGSIAASVSDEYTFYAADAPMLEGAKVTVYNAYTNQIIRTGYSDANGNVRFDDLEEGVYLLKFSAAKHGNAQKLVTVKKGEAQKLDVMLNLSTVTYSYEVVPVSGTDEYEIVLSTDFQTNIPAPVITVDMPTDFSDLEVGQTRLFTITLTNHGLINAEDIDLFFPNYDEYVFTLLSDLPDVIAPNSSCTLSVKLEHFDPESSDPQNSASAEGKRCLTGDLGVLYFWVCGQDRKWHRQSVAVDFGGCPEWELNIQTDNELPYTGNIPVYNSIEDYVQRRKDIEGNYHSSTWSELQSPKSYGTTSQGCEPCQNALLNTVVKCGLKIAYEYVKSQIDVVEWVLKGFDLTDCEENSVSCARDLLDLEAIDSIDDCTSALADCKIISEEYEERVKRIIRFVRVAKTVYDCWKEYGRQMESCRNAGSDSMMSDAGPYRETQYTNPVIDNYDIAMDLVHSFSTMFFYPFAPEIVDGMEYDGDALGEWFCSLLEVISSSSAEGAAITEDELASLRTQAASVGVSEQVANVFIDYWERSFEYYGKGIFSENDVPAGENKLFLSKERIQNYVNAVDSYQALLSQYEIDNMFQYVLTSMHDLLEYADSLENGVCAKVSLEFSQSVMMAREAFEGTLTITNNDSASLENFTFVANVMNQDGIDVSDLFKIVYTGEEGFSTTISGADSLRSLNGNTTGTISVIYLPGRDVSVNGQESYKFSGKISYTSPNGNFIEIDLAPVTLMVMPSPVLTLDYFVERDVYGDDPFTEGIEASIPAEIAVLVRNSGLGDAKEFKMSGFTPKIVDNEKGLLLNYRMVDAALNGQENDNGILDVNMGTIQAQSASVAQWWYESNLQGHYTNYEISSDYLTFTYSDRYGNTHVVPINDNEYGFVESAEIHELIRSVQCDDDALPDFLVNDLKDTAVMPDTLYLSNGDVLDVNAVTSAVVSGSFGMTEITITLTATLAEGWNYLRILDPGNGDYELTNVARGEICLNARNFWQSDRYYVDEKGVKYEDRLNILDNAEAASDVVYTLTYTARDRDPLTVESVSAPETVVNTAIDSITVVFNKSVNPESFTFADLDLFHQGNLNNNLISSDVTITRVDDRTFTINNLAGVTAADGFYQLIIRTEEITDSVGNAGSIGKSVTWTNASDAPALSAITGIDALMTSKTDSVTLEFNAPINPATLTSSLIAVNGNQANVAIAPVGENNMTFALSGLAAYLHEGENSLEVDMTKITNTAGNTGHWVVAKSWIIDLSAPVIEEETSKLGVMNSVPRSVAFTFSEEVFFDASALNLKHNGTLIDTDGLHIAICGNTAVVTGIPTTLVDGNYELILDLAKVTDAAGNTGIGSATRTWSLDTVAPSTITDLHLAASCDWGESDSDNRTASKRITLAGSLPETDLTVSVYQQFGSLRTMLYQTIASSAALSADLNVAGGNSNLIVKLTDQAGNSSESSLAVFVDEAVFSAQFAESFENELNDSPSSVTVILSEAISELKLTDFSLYSGDKALSLAGCVVTRVNSKEWMLSGISGNANGDYRLSLNLANLSKLSTGLSGNGTLDLNWTVSNAVAPTIVASSLTGNRTLDSLATFSITFSDAMNCADLIATGTIIQAVKIIQVDAAGDPERVILLDKNDFQYVQETNTLVWRGMEAFSDNGRYRLQLDHTLLRSADDIALAGGSDSVQSMLVFQSGTTIPATGTAYSIPVWTDFNGDGLDDLLIGEKADGTTGKIRLYLNTGTATAPTFGDYVYLQSSDGDWSIAAANCLGVAFRFADVNGDGASDIVYGTSDGQILWSVNSGDTFGVGEALTVSGSGIDVGSRAVFDLYDWDGDGKLDILSGAMDGKVYLYVNNGDWTFASAQILDIQLAEGWSSVAVADLNGDGQADIISGDAKGNLFAFLNNGNKTFAQITIDTSRNVLRSRPFAADANGDGVTDLIVGYSDGSVWVFAGNTGSSSGTPFRIDTDSVFTDTPEAIVVGYNVTISWKAPTDAVVSYKVKVGDTLYNVNETALLLTAMDVGTYNYQIAACDADGLETWSSVESFTIADVTAPVFLEIPVLKQRKNSITVSWDAATDNVAVAGYKFELNGMVYTTDSLSYSLNGLELGNYEYRVAAYDTTGLETWSEKQTFLVSELADNRDHVLAHAMPSADYGVGCVPASIGMLLGYYDLYGYCGYDVSDLIAGVITVDSRGDDTALLNTFISSTDYASRFVGQTPNAELDYTFIPGTTDLNIGAWNSLADYLGTGQYWRGSADYATAYYFGSLADLEVTTETYSVSGKTLPAKYADFKYGLDLFVKSVGYDLDADLTRTVKADTQAGGTFSFEDLISEIDAGRGVLISLVSPGNLGHMVLGYGYNEATREIIFDDTTSAGRRMGWRDAYQYGGHEYRIQSVTTIVLDTSDLNVFDTIPPVKPVVHADITTTTDQEVTVTAVFSADSVVKEFSLDGLIWSSYIALIKFSENGTVFFRSADEAGNLSEVTSYTVDNIEKVPQIISGAVLINESRTVSASQVYLDTTVSSGGVMLISSGGTANSTMVNALGLLCVSSGGMANSTTVDTLGYLYIYNGGTANSTTVDDFGYLCIYSGGTANSTTVDDFGYLYIYNGGAVNNTMVYSSGTITVSSGGTANKTTVSSGGLLYICKGASATNVDWTPCAGKVWIEDDAYVTFASQYSGVYYGSNNQLLSHASVMDSKIVSGYNSPCMYVMSDGFANSTTINEYGSMFVCSGGTAANTRIDSGGYMLVSSGGTATNVDWTPCVGSIWIADGAYVTFTSQYSGVYYSTYNQLLSHAMVMESKTINDDEVMYIMSGGIANATVIDGWGSMYVSNGGIANNTIFNDLGELYVCNGGVTNNTTVNSGGDVYISSGGTANNTTISHCNMDVISGGLATNTTVDYWSNLYVSSGGVVDSTTVNYWGNLVVSSDGTADNTTVNSGGDVTVSSGGTANNNIINSGGCLIISSGGTADNTTINAGGSGSLSCGMANSTTINSEGDLYVYSGGIANSTMVNAGGRMTVTSGGSTDNTTVNAGGWMYVYSGGTATNVDWTPCVGSVSIADGAYVTFTSQYSGVYYGDLNQLLSHAMVMTSKTIDGSMYVMSGGLADNTVVSHGSMYVSSGGTANYTSVHSWGGGDVHVRDGGVANNTLLYDGQMLISSGGTANDTVIVGDNSMYIGWGSMYVLHGGTANRTTVNYGGSMYVSGGTANSTTVNSGGTLFIADGGMANDTMIIDVGSVFISSGGMANNTVLNSWGAMHCFAGGTATRTSIEGGRTYIDSDGVADSTTVMAGGLFISSGGMASNTVVFGGGIDISSGGIADNTVIQSGNIYLCDGGIAHNVTISQGRILIYSGGTMTGRMVFEEGVIVSSLQNAAFHLDFDISDLAPETVARVNNLALIKGAPLYTLTVSDKQSIGTYTLAEGASEFNGTISVVNTSGTELGILTLNGDETNINGSSYTLHLNKDNVLFVTVNTADMPPSDVAPQTQTWEKVEVATQYTVEYSTDNFEHVIQLVVDSNSLDSFQMPAGNYQMRVKADGGEEWSVAVPVVAEEANNEPKLIRSNADGHADVFFVNSVGTWESGYAAQHVGSTDDDTWDGTEEYASLFGKNKLTDIIEGSTDANVLLMTDDSIGDALFVDDIYSASPDELGLSQSRIAQIDEIRAGAGNDIVDMTSQRFEYIGEGLTIRGGDGNDTIWANKGNNILFGDAGNDRIVGASGNDVIAGGIGNDRMHGGGNDIFTFCDNWGIDEVEQLADGSVTLWFTEGSKANWDEATLTYTDGNNSVKVSGVAAEKVTLKFGDDGSEQYAKLASAGAFAKFTSQKIFENADTTTGVIASLE